MISPIRENCAKGKAVVDQVSRRKQWRERGILLFEVHGNLRELPHTSVNIIETEMKTQMARAYLCSCSDSSYAQPARSCRNHLQSLEDKAKSFRHFKKVEPKLSLFGYYITADIDTVSEEQQLELIDFKSDHSWKKIFVL
ncbi:hypothetical protein TNCV_4248981 [Trichonephila clavipes]|nr:hypothetical protein TNCV_4248981 [Trichonephila clavipes]